MWNRIKQAGFLLLLAPWAPAAEPIDTLDWGLRAGVVQTNYQGADPAVAAGAGLIYRHRQYPSLALEADLLVSIADGDIGGRDFSLAAVAAGLAWRSQGSPYLKLRGGVLAEYVEVGPADAWGSGASGSVGAGWRHGEQLVELELTGLEKSAWLVSLAWYF